MGTEKIGRLSRLGFSSLAECLLVVPKEFRDYQEPLNILPIPDTGSKQYLLLTLVELEAFDKKGESLKFVKGNARKLYRLSMRGVDGRGDSIPITIFGGVWSWMDVQLGDELHIYGEVTTWRNRRQINNPDIVPPEYRGRVVPVYKGKPGQVSGESIFAGVTAAIGCMNDASCILLEQIGIRESEFRSLTGLQDPADLLRAIHQPMSVREGEAAVRVAKQLSIKAILNRAMRNQSQVPVAGSSIAVDRTVIQSLISRLPFPPTSDQKQAIDEIVSDLRSPFPMKRLLSGDVGTGKTVAFAVPAVAAFLAGARVGIVVPNELLVGQIAGEIREYFPEIPVCEVSSGGSISDGLVVGTTAVFSIAKKKGIVFDFVVTDEQHKFSVGQKGILVAAHTNMLEATATAIPRTLALVQFGGLALSVLKENPVKKEIKTRVVARAEGGRLFEFVAKQTQSGAQVAVIYPLAEDKGDGERMTVEAAARRFETMWPGRVGMLHGGLPDEEKNAVIAKMKSGDLSVLCSSTVIEVGLTLPSLRAVIVVHPERFGSSQLHQLRGRVARRGGVGFFFLYLPEDVEDTAMQRLQLLVECKDGFTLAERDADLRGFGDVDHDSGSQKGASRMLFWGVTLSREEIETATSESIEKAIRG